MIWWTVLLLLVGFAGLIKGADFFVEGSSSVAKLLRVPSLIIGLTVVAFGTSMPELAVSVTAAVQGSNEIAISNVIGSNIFNLLMVVGVSTLVKPMQVQPSVLKKEFPFSIFVGIVLLFLCSDQWIFQWFGIIAEQNVLSRLDGGILLLLFALFMYGILRDAGKARKKHSAREEKDEIQIMTPAKSILYIIGGLAGIVIGGQLVVNSATEIAREFGLSETLIGLTIVAIGTSLPELVTSVVAAIKGECEIALGNVVGSNVFNVLMVLGLSITISPIRVEMTAVYDLFILAVVSLLILVFLLWKKRVPRYAGAMMVAVYAAYTAYIILR